MPGVSFDLEAATDHEMEFCPGATFPAYIFETSLP